MKMGPMSARWTPALTCALLLVGFLVGCGGGESEGGEPATESHVGPTSEELRPQRDLAELQNRLERTSEVDEIAQSELRARRALFDEKGVPKRIRPTEGIHVTLANGDSAFVYRYESKELASAGAASFLGAHDPSNGVLGCGKNVFFARVGLGERIGERWEGDVSHFLAKRDPSCGDTMFIVE